MARLLAEMRALGPAVAEHPAAPGEGVFVQIPGRLVLASRTQQAPGKGAIRCNSQCGNTATPL
jgi:hypothetical protein